MLAAIAALWALGLAEFSHALDPTRSESNGVDLPLAGARLDGAGDWHVEMNGSVAAATRTGLTVQAPGKGELIYSRRVPVFPQDCYDLVVEGHDRRPGIVVQVLSDGLRALTAAVPLSEASPSAPLEFSPDGHHAVIVTFLATRRAAAVLTDARLSRRASGCTTR